MTARHTNRTRDELDAVAARFGVAPEQARRDLLISHVLGSIAAHFDHNSILFIGGTALARTHLPYLRLSEDVDLIALATRAKVAAEAEQVLPRGLARQFPALSWNPSPVRTRGSSPAVLTTGDGLRVQIQILSSVGDPPWPSEIREIEQRYSDAPPARLRTYTAAGFAAAKLDAWISRRAARDLFDMWAMAHQGMITGAALDLFTRHGQLTSLPERWMFERLPTAAEWDDQLAHQTSVTVAPQDAARVVAQAWATAARYHGFWM